MQVDRFRQLMVGTGETIRYSGGDDDQHTCMAGVALILKKGLKKALTEWQPVNERLILKGKIQWQAYKAISYTMLCTHKRCR